MPAEPALGAPWPVQKGLWPRPQEQATQRFLLQGLELWVFLSCALQPPPGARGWTERYYFRCRFFYQHIWRSWDEEEEDEYDYFVRCVEPRLRL